MEYEDNGRLVTMQLEGTWRVTLDNHSSRKISPLVGPSCPMNNSTIGLG